MRKTVASAVGRVSDAVRGIVGDLNPGTLSGAIDIIVVETPAQGLCELDMFLLVFWTLYMSQESGVDS